jgi:hypothetical protein
MEGEREKKRKEIRKEKDKYIKRNKYRDLTAQKRAKTKEIRRRRDREEIRLMNKI